MSNVIDNISRYITYHMSVFSRVGNFLGIVNKPSARQLNVMRYLGYEFFDSLVENYGKEIHINSFYRNKLVNAAVGGMAQSKHRILGDIAAIDLDAQDNNELFLFIKDNCRYNQIIAEYPAKGKVSWVHVSYSLHDIENEKREALIIVVEKGKRKCVPYLGNERFIYE